MATATYRTLEVTLISAKDLKDVNLISKLETYAVVSISGLPSPAQRSRTDREGRRNPTWNAMFRFHIPRSSADLGHLTLEVLIRTERRLGDRDVGTVSVRLSALESGASTPDGGTSDSPTFLSYLVRRPSGNRGLLNISYKFVEPDAAATLSAAPMVYPPPFLAPPPPAGYGYPHHAAREAVSAYPMGVGAPYHHYPVPNAAYYQQVQLTTSPRKLHRNHPPPPPSYGYTVAPPPPPYRYQLRGDHERSAPSLLQTTAKSGFRAGLVGGAVGGVVVGSMMSEAASALDYSYDAGYNDSAYDF